MSSFRGWGFFALVLLFACSWPCFGESAVGDQLSETNSLSSRALDIRINPINLLFGVAMVEADFKIAPRLTLGPQLGLTMASSDISGVSAKGLSFGARLNWYFTGDALTTGWYLSPIAGYTLDYLTMGDFSGQIGGMYFGGLIGHQWVFDSGFDFSIGAGMTHYGIATGTTAQDGIVLATPGIYGWVPTLDISLGLAI